MREIPAFRYFWPSLGWRGWRFAELYGGGLWADTLQPR
jgi:hypothetical protein